MRQTGDNVHDAAMKTRRKSRKFRLRTDLLEYLTDKDILESALANVHRYKPEPLLSKTGVGYLAPATPEDREQEMKRSEALMRRLKQRQRKAESLIRRKKK
jgi:hypothetical protein